jgi:hypothetical protein
MKDIFGELSRHLDVCRECREVTKENLRRINGAEFFRKPLCPVGEPLFVAWDSDEAVR